MNISKQYLCQNKAPNFAFLSAKIGAILINISLSGALCIYFTHALFSVIDFYTSIISLFIMLYNVFLEI